LVLPTSLWSSTASKVSERSQISHFGRPSPITERIKPVVIIHEADRGLA